jgi:predicted CopG family antitoxin
MNRNHNLTTISISYKNYFHLKEMGKAGESFNDVLTKLLTKNSSELSKQQQQHRYDKIKQEGINLQRKSEVGAPTSSVASQSLPKETSNL